jgi:hypothetical protein
LLAQLTGPSGLCYDVIEPVFGRCRHA